MPAIFDRVYRLELGGEDEILTLDGFEGEPAQMQFQVTNHADSMIQVAEITVYGLSAESRRKLHDLRYKQVRLVAGYREYNGEIFRGTIYNVGIGRDGPEVFVTLYCRAVDEKWENASINKAWGSNTPALEVIRDVAGTFGYSLEFVGDFSDLPPLITGLTMSVDSKTAMRSLARNYSFSWLIENNRLVITRLGAERQQNTPIVKISAETGMVGSPRIRERGIDVTAKMNVTIQTYDRVEVENATGELLFNNPNIISFPDTIGTGIYLARGVTHVGDFYGDTWDTIIEGWNPRVRQLPRTGQ